MRLSRTDLVPVLTIMAGGAIGLSLSLNFLLLAPSGDVPSLDLAPVVDPAAPVPPVAPLGPVEPTTRVRIRVGTVTGQITDRQTGGTIAAAQVFISSLDRGGLTHQNGRYLLQNVPAGAYTLTVARIGYQTTHVRIVVAGDQTMERNFAISAETAYPYRFAPTVRYAPASRSRYVPTSAEITERQKELLRRLLENANN